MEEKQLQALANEMAKNLKNPQDLNQFVSVRASRLVKEIPLQHSGRDSALFAV